MPVRLERDPGNAPLIEPGTPAEFARAFRLPPEEAVRYMQGRARVRVSYDWHALWQDEHARAFTVSRLTRADLLADLREKIEQSVNGDLSRRDFMRDARAMLADAGWWGVKQLPTPDGRLVETRFNPARLKLIYDVNTRMAHAAGRWERIQAAKASHPFLRYVTRADERVRQSHRQWHNVTLPVDDTWWQTHYPPNGWRCRCTAVALRAAEVARRPELKRAAPDEPMVEWTNPVTGEVKRVPHAIDPGFAYNVGEAAARWRGLIDAMAGRLAKWPPELGAALWESLDDADIAGVAEGFAGFVDAALSGPPRGALALAGAIPSRWLATLDGHGARPSSAEIMLRDHDLWHMRREGKDRRLPVQWLRLLPLHLRRPQAVLLDRRHDAAALLMLFDGEGGAKLVVRLDYRLKKQKGTLANLIRTGAQLNASELSALRGEIGRGLTLLEGDL